MTARRNRTRSPARGRPRLEPKPLILVVCEGEKTEPNYFSSFKSASSAESVGDFRLW